MMKLVGSNPLRLYDISRVLRSVLYSVEAQSSSSSPRKDSLYQRISGHGDPKSSIIPVLDRWVEEGRDVKQAELHKIVKQLRMYRRYSHALQMQEWMSDKMNFELTSGGMAVLLDLIAKVHGIGKAEEYFNSIPAASGVGKIYGALLNCYAEKKSLEKADGLFQKMKELGFVKCALTYNVLLSLYSRTGNREKFNNLVREMQENGMEGDSYTFCIRLNAYASSDLEEMEKLLAKMEADSGVKMDFHMYFVAAKGYLRAGLSKKALPIVWKAEELIRSKGNKIDYEHLITLYAAAGNKDEVYRIWNIYKKGRAYNNGYLSVISSLLKLEDIDGAEEIFEEWLSGATGFDNRIVNVFISAYCKNRLVEKAFACVERLTNKGHKLEPGTWQCLANMCCLDGQPSKAVEPMKKAILGSGRKWKLNRYTLADCLEYLKREGDREEAQEFLKSLTNSGSFSDDVCNRLVEFLNSDKESGALAAMEEENPRTEDHNLAIDGKMNR